MEDITFITSNEHKAAQISWHFATPIQHQALDLLELQSLDIHEVVEHKAKAAYEILQKPVLVEDTSLTFLALGKLPGTLIKWFLTELGNEGLSNLVSTDRRATAAVCFGLYDGNEMHFFDAGISGIIAESPRGEKGFGWDPIFIPEGHNKTWGEMTMDEQIATSVRRPALKKLEVF